MTIRVLHNGRTGTVTERYAGASRVEFSWGAPRFKWVRDEELLVYVPGPPLSEWSGNPLAPR